MIIMNIDVPVSQKIRRKLIVVIQEQVSPKRIAAIQGKYIRYRFWLYIIFNKWQDVKPLYDAVVAEAPDYNMDKIKSR